MQIDRSNYEIWLIDWLDGNLSDHQIDQLKSFLNENPGLKEEFDELNTISLKPSDKSFPDKNNLKKSSADLPGSQFDYLCVTCLEKDLSDLQRSELNEIIDRDPEKKKSFELIQKMHLSPGNISYKHKSKLLKRTAAQKIVRLTVIGLSAAAAIALLIMTYIIIPRSTSDINIHSAQNKVIDTNSPKNDKESAPEKLQINKPIILSQKQSDKLFAVNQTVVPVINEKESYISQQNDTLVRDMLNSADMVNKIFVTADIDFKVMHVSGNLIASKSAFKAPVYEDGRSKLSRFIAKNFREKILKENTSKDSPLKAYEIAEAGVTGLNKLLGWEMALDERNDENGELKSVYFSSKILKFNTPVKKTEPLP
jgi:hypothetical protein